MDAERLATERAAIAARYPGVAEKHDLGAPVFEGSVDVDGVDYLVRLVLPQGFPTLPPEVGEIELPGGPLTHPEGGMHRFRSGTICLFPHGNDPQAWHPHRHAVEALDRFVELKRRENEAKEGPMSALFRAPWRLVVPPRLAEMLLLEGSHGSLELRMSPHGGDVFVDGVCFDWPELPRAAQPSAWLKALTSAELVPWVHHAFSGRSWWEVGRSAAALDRNLREALRPALYERIRAKSSFVLVREAPTGGEADVVLFEKREEHLGALYVPEVTMAEPEDLFFQRVDGVMNDRDKLSSARVVIVGLGSLGGAVALALARAGVRSFALVDPDKLALDNVCRHVGTLRDLGRDKVDVVKEALLSVNPTATVEVFPKPFGWDLPGFSAGREVDRFVASGGPVVIISTCAVARIEQQINKLAVKRGVSAVFGAVLGAAEHARVFRVTPGVTACYACVVAAQEREPDRHPRFSSGTQVETHRPYGEPSLPGLGVDVTMSAMIIARMALQEITALVGADPGLGRSDEHILWTNRGGWIFDRPLQSCAERIARDPACLICGAGRRELDAG